MLIEDASGVEFFEENTVGGHAAPRQQLILADRMQLPRFSTGAFRVDGCRDEQHKAQRRQEASAHSTTVSRQHACASRSERKGFPNLRAPKSAIDHLVKKSKKIGEIDPKSAIETASIETPVHERIVPLDHHEAFALETIHRSRSQ